MKLNINNCLEDKHPRLDQLVNAGFLTEEMVVFLKKSVQSRKNILIKGDMFSGKTTLKYLLCQEIPKGELILDICNVPEYPKEENYIHRDIRKITIKDEVLSTKPDRITCDFMLNKIFDLVDTSEILNNGYIFESSKFVLKALNGELKENTVDYSSILYKLPSLFEIVVTTEYIMGCRKVTKIEKTELSDRNVKTIEIYKNPIILE